MTAWIRFDFVRPMYTRSLAISTKRGVASLPEITITKTNSTEETSQEVFRIPTPSISTSTNATNLVDDLLQTTASMMDITGSNIIAYSGGVDSTLVAALVQKTFTSSSHHASPPITSGNTEAVLGVSPAVPSAQIELARHIARDIIQIPLREVPTAEGADPVYIENKGQACLACKTELYSTLKAVAEHAIQYSSSSSPSSSISSPKVILFNGTNKDDTTDPTRLGLIAADNFHVRSPLQHITKDQVRTAAKHLGLPNWNHAASPCLRSRLALGVEATKKHLKMVEEGEIFVRNVLDLSMEKNLRVRLLSGGRAGVELDEDLLLEDHSSTKLKRNQNEIKEILIRAGFKEFLENAGFASGEFVMRKFKSGSISGAPIKMK